MPRMTVPGNKSLADRAAATMPAFGAVRRIATGKTMALHHAFKAAAFGDADGVNEIAGRKQRRADDVAGLHFLGEIAEFADAFHRRAVLFFDVAEQRLRQALFLLVVKAELNGIVAVLARLRFDLQHAVRSGEHDRHGDDVAGRVIDARVSEFFS